MDPASIVGTTGAVLSILEIVAKSITTLWDLRDRFKNMSLEISNLITQLNSLRAALEKISDWISSDLAHMPQHYQLVMDLDEAITCCQALILSVDDQLSKLRRNNDESLSTWSEAKVILQSNAFENFQKHMERQISALNLLLTACNCKTLSEQKRLLESSKTREILNKPLDNSSSLIVLHDSASLFSRATASTGTSSKWSKEFTFDDILMKSNPYQRTIRDLFKRGQFRRSQPPTSRAMSPTQNSYSKSAGTDSDPFQILLTGTSRSELQAVYWTIQKGLQGRHPEAMVKIVTSNFQALKIKAQESETFFVCADETLRSTLKKIPPKLELAEQIQMFAEIWDEMPVKMKDAADRDTLRMVQCSRWMNSGNGQLSFEYLPDIAYEYPRLLWYEELNTMYESRAYRVLKAPIVDIESWRHEYENVTNILMLVYVADLESYNGYPLDRKCEESLNTLCTLAAKAVFRAKPIFIIFTGYDHLLAKDVIGVRKQYESSVERWIGRIPEIQYHYMDGLVISLEGAFKRALREATAKVDLERYG